jgi:polyketide cyclase/dehydrase/lipid transport protein
MPAISESGSIILPIPVDVAWAIITDLGHPERWDPDIARTTVLGDSSGTGNARVFRTRDGVRHSEYVAARDDRMHRLQLETDELAFPLQRRTTLWRAHRVDRETCRILLTESAELGGGILGALYGAAILAPRLLRHVNTVLTTLHETAQTDTRTLPLQVRPRSHAAQERPASAS